MNNLNNPDHTFVDADQKLIESALQILERLEEESAHEDLRTMRMAIAELDSKTRIVIDRARSHHLLAQLDGNFNSMDPISFLDSGTSTDDSSAFAGDFVFNNTAMDTELFGSLLENQFFDTGVSRVDSALLDGKETPNFDSVVAVFLRQPRSWF